MTTATSNTTAPTQFLRGRNETYAYRRFGSGPARPLLFLQHFTGTLDNWDPAVTDPLARPGGPVHRAYSAITHSPSTLTGGARNSSGDPPHGLNRVRLFGFLVVPVAHQAGEA
jgi:hypothetical protein